MLDYYQSDDSPKTPIDPEEIRRLKRWAWFLFIVLVLIAVIGAMIIA